MFGKTRFLQGKWGSQSRPGMFLSEIQSTDNSVFFGLPGISRYITGITIMSILPVVQHMSGGIPSN